MSQALRAGPPDFARVAAIERLTEMHAAGRISEEQFEGAAAGELLNVMKEPPSVPRSGVQASRRR